MNTDITERELNRIRKNYPKGTRVELISMDDSYSKLKKGDKGTVKYVDDAGTIHVSWDCGSGLGIIHGVDEFKVIKD